MGIIKNREDTNSIRSPIFFSFIYLCGYKSLLYEIKLFAWWNFHQTKYVAKVLRAAKSLKAREYMHLFFLRELWFVDYLKAKWDKAKYTNDICYKGITYNIQLIIGNHFQ